MDAKILRLLEIIHQEHLELARLYGTREYQKLIEKRWEDAKDER